MDNVNVFDEANELKSNFVKWGKPGDYIVGTLVRVFQMPDNYAKVPGTKKNIYELKAREGSFNDIQNKKLTGEVITIVPGDLYCVDGKAGLEPQLKTIKIGQVIGVKFMEERTAKDPKNFDAKITKVYAPKGKDNGPLMDEEWLKSQDTFDSANALPPVDFSETAK